MIIILGFSKFLSEHEITFFSLKTDSGLPSVCSHQMGLQIRGALISPKKMINKNRFDMVMRPLESENRHLRSCPAAIQPGPVRSAVLLLLMYNWTAIKAISRYEAIRPTH